MVGTNILFNCTIPGRVYVKKNVARHFRGKVVYSTQFTAWEHVAKLYVLQSKSRLSLATINTRVNLKCLFYFSNRQSEPDLSALYEGIQDVLQDCEVLENDRLIYSHDGSKKIMASGQSKLELEITNFIE